MNVKAKIHSMPVTIIAITNGFDNDAAKVVYVKQDGSLGYAYSDSPSLKITDEDYLSKETEQ